MIRVSGVEFRGFGFQVSGLQSRSSGFVCRVLSFGCRKLGTSVHGSVSKFWSGFSFEGSGSRSSGVFLSAFGFRVSNFAGFGFFVHRSAVFVGFQV